jgi:hypothetical protein
MPWTGAAVASNKTCTDTAAGRTTRSTAPDEPCTPARTCSPTSKPTGSPPCSPSPEHVEVEATWGIYQRMIAAYREPNRATGREQMEKLIA